MKETIQLAIIIGIFAGFLLMVSLNSQRNIKTYHISDGKQTEFHMALEDSVAIAFERETEQ